MTFAPMKASRCDYAPSVVAEGDWLRSIGLSDVFSDAGTFHRADRKPRRSHQVQAGSDDVWRARLRLGPHRSGLDQIRHDAAEVKLPAAAAALIDSFSAPRSSWLHLDTGAETMSLTNTWGVNCGKWVVIGG